jgi:hypothetical protein
MAGKPQFTPEQMVAALNDCGGMMFLAARKLGCSYRTVENYKKRYAVVRQACEQKKGEMVDAAESALHRAVLAGEAWAVCFCLKTQGKARGYVERQEYRNVSDDDIERAVEAELAAVGRRRPGTLPDEAASEEDPPRPGGPHERPGNGRAHS